MRGNGKRCGKLSTVLAAERNRIGISQAELAKRLKTTQSFVARFETGHRKLTVGEFVQVARVIGCDPIRLLRTVLASP